MEQLTTILILLFAVSISGVLSLVSRISLPLLQIGIGIALAGLHVHSKLDPSLFLLLFVAPLLYVDAYQFPRAEFLSLRRPILTMAVGLVVFTVIGAGYYIHWMIPAMPLAASFALAAVLSPTDAVAVAGSTKSVRIPSRVMHLLEGESLFNDASGLVCFRFAVTAALTGAFSLTHALLNFLQVSLGGLAVGALLAFCLMHGEQWVAKRLGSHPAAQILLSLLLPFAAYLAAEHLEFSGILAAVGAGFVGNWVTQEIPIAEVRIKSEAITDMVQFTFNGLIFILLGLQLPSIAKSIPSVIQQEDFHSPWILGFFVLGITLILSLLRYFWTWSSLRWTLYRRRKHGGAYVQTPRRLLLATTLAGVRGAVTLAAVLSLPLTVSDGSRFPGRDLAILLAAGVILISLLLASISLPIVMKGVQEPPEASAEVQERNARVFAAKAAIKRLEVLREEPPKEIPPDSPVANGYISIASRLMDYYRRRVDALSGEGSDRARAAALRSAERKLRLEAVRAERAEVNRLLQERALEPGAARNILHKLDNTEATLQG